MNRVSSSANLAAVFAFLIGFLEFGVVSGGLAWAVEDAIGGSRAGHLAVLALAMALSLAFAAWAAVRARRFQASQAVAREERGQ